ncbi:MAG TPA: acetylglutamate kinase [Flavisolibacter sp.]
MEPLYVIKIGGNVIDDEQALFAFLEHFAAIKEKKILVHGGGRVATEMAEKLGIPQQMTGGRRVTDAETLRVVTMVYAGLINKSVVARLQALGCNAIGLSGADGNAISAHQRVSGTIDFGFAGDIDQVNTAFFRGLFDQHLTPVIAPITHDGNGQLLNTNADTVAQETAKAMSGYYDTVLVYSFEKAGVLLDINDPSSIVSELDHGRYNELRGSGAIFAGMIPKLDNAFSALDAGVRRVIIGSADNLAALVSGATGTTITNER